MKPKEKQVKKENFEKIYNKIEKVMQPKGMNCGNQIARLLKRKNNITIPLYRSCIVLTLNKNGTILLETYHDPHWMGRELNLKTLKEFKDPYSLLFQGQRSGVDYWLNLESINKSLEISSSFMRNRLVEAGEKAQKDYKKMMKEICRKGKK